METVAPTPSTAPLERYATAATATSALGIAWVAGRGLLPFDAPCPILATTGVPCPLCGMTRLTDHLARGNLVEAIARDPAGVVFLAVLGLLALLGVGLRLGWSPRRWPAAAPALSALLLALGAHWLTTLSGGGFVDA